MVDSINYLFLCVLILIGKTIVITWHVPSFYLASFIFFLGKSSSSVK